MEQGILDEALRLVGAPAQITQLECFRKGADVCRYQLKSAISDARWMGGRPPIAL